MRSIFAEIHYCISLNTKIGLMLDGITIKYKIQNLEIWRRSLNIALCINVETETGEIRTKKRGETTIITHWGKWETFDLTIKEVLNNDNLEQLFYLTIKGSLHKNHYGGTNYLPFTWQQLQDQITHICETLCIDPSKAQISILEIGVNISLPFPVTPFLRRNVISYKGYPFNRYKADGNGICLGIYCNLSQYVVKLYDKGLQNKLQGNLMRYELRFLKMLSLNNRGVKYLSDLQDHTKVNELLSLLLDKWENVLIYDITTLRNLTLKQKDIDLLIEGQNPKFWERLKEIPTGDCFKYKRNKFKKLVTKYGNLWQTKVKELIYSEWQNLFKNYPNLPTGQTTFLPEFTIKINGKNGEKRFTAPEEESEFFYMIKKGNAGQLDTIKKRDCLSCGRDISNQHSRSKFCSGKFVGEMAAHECRNKDSNPRNNLKRKIEVINRRGVLFDVIPFLINNNYPK